MGAIVTDKVDRRIGLGRSLLLGVLLTGGSDLFFPSAGRIHTQWLVIGLLIIAQLFFGIGLTMFQIKQVSLRQSLTPNQLQGRMNATLSMLSWGIAPLGALLGGMLGLVIGLSPTLFVAALGEMAAGLLLVFSPLGIVPHKGAT